MTAETGDALDGRLVDRPIALPLQRAGQQVDQVLVSAAEESTRRVLTRIAARRTADVVGVMVGLTAFLSMSGPLQWDQYLWSLSYLVVALLTDATASRRSWTCSEEIVLGLRVVVAALLLTGSADFAGMPVSRILFCTVMGTLLLMRPLITLLTDHLTRVDLVEQRLLLLCDDHEHRELIDAIAESRRPRLRVVASMRQDSDDAVEPDRVVTAHTVAEACRRLSPTRIVFGNRVYAEPALMEVVTRANESGVAVRSVDRTFEEEFGRVSIRGLNASWFLFDIGPLHRIGYRAVRRCADVLAGGLVLVVLLPLLPVLALLIKLDSAGPVFFRQRRVGHRGRTFDILKLRTMRADAERDGPQFAGQGDPRVTRLGRWLRRSRLDELPQALNLLRGDMSLVGPRPERPEFVELFSTAIPFYGKRHLIKPGLTGWAQVHEGYGASVDETRRKLERDLFYLKHHSLSLDLHILAATVASVLRLAGR